MKLSIVITYWNRRRQLLNTLSSIAYFKGDYPIEVIIVDDDSSGENVIDDLLGLFPLPIKLVVLKNRAQHDPVIPLNTAFNEVTGDVVLINCAECVHMGDIIGYIFKNIRSKSYFNFATYSIDSVLTDLFFKLNWSEQDVLQKAHNIIQPLQSLPEQWKDGDTGWYVDDNKHYSLLPFCAAINTEDIQNLSGLDERFINGIGYADTDFAIRIVNLHLDASVIIDPFCVHQFHDPTVYENVKFDLNNKLIASLQGKFPDRIKATENIIYKR